MSEDFVNVIWRNDQHRVAIKSHWRTLPDDEGFILLKDKISTFCGFPPLSIRSGDGVIIRSLDFISSQDTVHVVESPPRYEASGQGLDDLGLMKGVLQKICDAIDVPFTDGNPSPGFKLPLVSKIAELEKKYQEISVQMDEKMANMVQNLETFDTNPSPEFKDALLAKVTVLENEIECLSARMGGSVEKLGEISDRFGAKSEEIERKYNLMTAEMREFKSSASELEKKLCRIPVAPNLIRDTFGPSSFSGRLCKFNFNKFLGIWEPLENSECTSVHPFVQGFEGCYSHIAPKKSVKPEHCAIADEDNPVFYGTYNMGPRSAELGLSRGWNGEQVGSILKLRGTRDGKYEIGCSLPTHLEGPLSSVRFTAWVKVVKGAVSFNIDCAYWNKPGEYLSPNRRNGVCRAEDCRNQPQGWYRMDDVIKSNYSDYPDGRFNWFFWLRCFGSSETNGLGDFEIYVASPHACLSKNGDEVTLPLNYVWSC